LSRQSRRRDSGLGDTLAGRVVGAHGRRFVVLSEDEVVRDCVVRGKRTELACGDRVTLHATGPHDGVIESILDRDTLFLRASPWRQKLIAANIDQVLVLAAAEPSTSDEFLTRAIVAALHAGIEPVVVLNKIDLDGTDAVRTMLDPLRDAGHRIVEVCAKRDPTPVRDALLGHTTAIIGQSGMGKSTLLNALVPTANALTQEISTFLDTGRHTTTASRLYQVETGTAVIDCPGVQDFGLAHLQPEDIVSGFVETRPLVGQCRFNDCRHAAEPDCAVKAAVATGAMNARRHALMLRLVAER